MRDIKKTIALLVGLFLFFNFSNFDSFEDVLKNGINLDIPSLTDTKFKTHSEEKIEKAIVKRVIDGDTLEVELSGGRTETIRLLLVDTPETVKPNTPVQPFGEEASNFMKQILIKDTVIEVEKGISERDKYDRLLAYVWVDGKNINEEILKHGLGRVAYVYEPNTKYLDEFRKAEEEAKKQKKGIWSIDGYVTQNGFQ